MKAVVLCAGKGVRLRPLTDKVPKVMVKLSGKPLLERVLEKLDEAGITEACLIVGYKREAVEKHFGKEFKGIKLEYALQEEQMGTAHAIALAEKFVSGEKDFLVLNGDVLALGGLIKQIAEKDEFDDSDALMVARKVPDPWRYGVLVVQLNEVKDIVEKPLFGEEPSDLVNAGIYRFNESIFEAIRQTARSMRGEFEITDSIKNLISLEKKVVFVVSDSPIIDIGSKEDLEKAGKVLEENE
ncbi:MAG: sugar phosphate nucleotidyltransferase [Candidatus Diapherotrites archaeon]